MQNVSSKGLIQMEHLDEELFKVNKCAVFMPGAEPVSIPASVFHANRADTPCAHVPMA